MAALHLSDGRWPRCRRFPTSSPKPRCVGRCQPAPGSSTTVTLPFIAPILAGVGDVLRLIDSVKAFPLIFLLTGGGPGSLTEVTNYYAYLLAFDTNEIGYSSAVTVVMLLLVAAVSLGLVWMGRRREGLS